MNDKWKWVRIKPIDIKYNTNSEKEQIDQLKKYIQEHKEDETPITMKIGEMSILVDNKDTSKITFYSEGNIQSKIEKNLMRYPYKVIIKGENVHSEVYVIDEKLRTNYFNIKNNLGLIDISQTVSIIDGEKVNENFLLSGENKDIIVKELISNHSEFTQGNNGNFYREEIDPNLPIKQIEELIFALDPNNFAKILIDDEFNYKKLINSYKERKSRQSINTYGEGITIAKEIEEHCKYLYSLLMENNKTINKSKSPTSYIDYIGPGRIESEQSSYFYNKEDRLERIIRLNELIKLSKNQDKEIEYLENQLSKRENEIDK